MAISEKDFESSSTPILVTNKGRLARLMGNSYPISNKKFDKNRQQTGNKPATNRQRNWQQTGNKPITNRQQTDNEIVETKTKTDNKPTTKPITNRQRNWQQTDNKPTTNLSFSLLIGLQKKIIVYFFNECKNNRSKITNPTTLESIATYIKCSKNTAKTTLQRLEYKGYLIRKEFKNGRGGWSKYELPEYLYYEILRTETDNKLATNWQQTGNKLATKPTTKPTTNSSSSSSINNILTTTIEEKKIDYLPSEWKEVDLSGLQKRGVMFSQNHIFSLWDFLNKYSAFDFQESIDGFIHDIDNKILKTERGYLNFFIGIIRKGNLYISSHYISHAQHHINEMIDVVNKRKAEREELQKKLYDEKFYEWFKNYDKEKIKEKLHVSYWAGLEHNHPETMEWIKKNIYEPSIFGIKKDE